MNFPFGKAPFFILLVALATGLGVLVSHRTYGKNRPTLVMLTAARLHADIYLSKLPEFERRHNVKVDVQVMDQFALRTRLQAAFTTGGEVPDVVEMPQYASYFLRGPTKDVGLLDLTDWVKENKLQDRMVASRFSMWQRRGVVFGLPHDVHPTMLAYRADIVEDELKIDVSKIKTWDDFVAMARPIVTPNRFALELSNSGSYWLSMLMLQRGIGLFNAQGEVTFDQPEVADVVVWYLQQLLGPQRIAYDLGTNQPLWRGMRDGVVLFYFTPDWRTRNIELFAPDLKGKMKLMPLPAWTPGGRRTSTWGATGIGATKGSRNPELAKKLMEFLYVEQTDQGKSWMELHILPPVQSAWNLPAFETPFPFFQGQRIMRMYADLANDVPPAYASPYTPKAEDKLQEAFLNCATYYKANGENGLRDFVRAEFKRQADDVRAAIARNVLMQQ